MHTLLVTLDLVGTFVFALSGAVVGVRHRLDLFGVWILSLAAPTAGGVARDVLIGAPPPAAVIVSATTPQERIVVAASQRTVNGGAHFLLDQLMDGGGVRLRGREFSHFCPEFQRLAPIAPLNCGVERLEVL